MTVPPSWPTPQPIAFAAFSAPKIQITMNPPTNISGIDPTTIYFNLRTQSEDNDNGTLVLQIVGATVDDATNGIFSFYPSSAQTGSVEPGTYDYDVWFTNDPYEKQIAYGKCIVKKQQWQSTDFGS